jgi:hypothetical protein
MANQRTADLLIGAYKDEMSTRRKYELETPDGTVIDLYFPPITRFDRQKAQQVAGTEEALTVSTQLLCKMAQKEDGSSAFDMSDAPILQRSLPEKVLNDLELFLFDVNLDLDTAKKE